MSGDSRTTDCSSYGECFGTTPGHWYIGFSFIYIAATFYCFCGVLDGRSSYVLDFAAAGDAENSSSGR
jgi:hypothetical protein